MNLPLDHPKRVEQPLVCCAQCGDPLPLARYKDRDPKEHLLCAECGIENLPHTD